MDREEIARAERRRQALEALEFERQRSDALRDRLAAIVTELDGPGLDEAVFAQLAAADVEVVRPALQLEEYEPDEASEEEIETARNERTAWLEEEIVRLEEEIASSRRREQAFESYLAALGR